jgi:hypothetical protein
MPSNRSSHAPYFSGKAHHSIKDFFCEYEGLANACGLSERQKVETVVRYASSSIRDFWQSLDTVAIHLATGLA